MPKTFNAILIDAVNKIVKSVIVSDENFVDDANKLINAECYCQGVRLNRSDIILVDDNGQLTDPQNFFYYH